MGLKVSPSKDREIWSRNFGTKDEDNRLVTACHGTGLNEELLGVVRRLLELVQARIVPKGPFQ
jgi:hypothetical protein